MLITVFTPTYNRAKLLPRVYESLCKQTFRDFEWVIVDDGSVDDTKNVIDKLIMGNGQFLPCKRPEVERTIVSKTSDTADNEELSIRYFYQKNGGKHRAINRGVNEARGELFFIADSDDWLPDDALEKVASQYKNIRLDHSFAGVAGFDAYPNGQIIGKGDSFNVLDCSPVDLWCKYHVKGDMKEVFRTDVLREFPFPEIDGEKFCPEELVWIRISKKYKLRYFNQIIYIADYLPDGLSSRIVKLRMDNPLTAMLDCKEYIEFGVPIKKSLKNAINYWRWFYCLPQKHPEFPKLSKIWSITKPMGWLMHKMDLKEK